MMPYGADRKLLHWLIDRAIREDDTYVSWSSTFSYQRDGNLPELSLPPTDPGKVPVRCW